MKFFDKLVTVRKRPNSIDIVQNDDFSSLDQTKDLENLNNTLKSRCDQLHDDLKATRERYAQSSLKVTKNK